MEGEWRLDMENRAVNMQEEWVKLKQYNIPEGQFIVNNFTQDLKRTKSYWVMKKIRWKCSLMGYQY